MGFFANLRAFFTGEKKPQQAPKPKATTDYDGVSTTRFYGQKFDGGLSRSTLILDHAEIRQQVRTRSHESLQLRALIQSGVDTVVAQGLNLSPEPKYKLLGITPEAAKGWAADDKARFELWAMSQRASRGGKYNFFQAQRLMQKCLDRDGELFVALSYHSDPALLSPLRFEILDPDQIRESGYTWTATGASLNPPLDREGIVRNADGEEVAYKVWGTGADGLPRMTEIPRVGRGGRIMMLHAMAEIDYAGQLRGVSPYAVCIQDLENILDYTLAQVEKAKNQSNISFTVESESDEPADDPFRNLDNPGAGPAAKQFGSDPEPSPDAENVTEESLEPFHAEIPHTSQNRPGGWGIFGLKGKQKLKPFGDTSPSQVFNVFVDAYFGHIAASRGTSVQTVLKQFESNYSASRATLILDWRVIVQRRWELDYYVLGPMREMWEACEIASGRASAPGWADPRLRAAWMAHRFQGLPMPVIDPEVTMSAAKMALELGATTFEDTAQEYNDSDFESNCASLREGYKNLPSPPWGFSGGGNKAGDEKGEGGED